MVLMGQQTSLGVGPKPLGRLQEVKLVLGVAGIELTNLVPSSFSLGDRSSALIQYFSFLVPGKHIQSQISPGFLGSLPAPK